MRILGIDPGLNATGYGVILAQGGRVELVTAGTIAPPARQPLGKRLRVLYDELARVILATQPDTAVLEALYTHHQYVTTAALMAHARGVACLVSAQQRLALVDYLPTRVKKTLTGNGYASKEQVARMVAMRLGQQDPTWSLDATDALALAIAHAHFSEAPLAHTVVKPRRRASVLASL